MIQNQTLSIKKCNKIQSVHKYNKCQLVDKCKPFIASSILFLLVSVIITGVFMYYYFNSQSKRKLKDYYQTYYY